MDFEPPQLDECEYDKLDDDQGLSVTSTTCLDDKPDDQGLSVTSTTCLDDKPDNIAPKTCSFVADEDVKSSCHATSLCDVVYWRAPLRSAIILVGLLILQISMMCCSFISVVSYIGLCVCLVSIAFCIYHQILGQDNPFKPLLASGTMIPEVCISSTLEKAAVLINAGIRKLTPFILVESYCATFKFMCVMFVGVIIGSCFNFLTLLFLATICSFTVPRIYEQHKTQIDDVIRKALDQVYKVHDIVKEKLKTLPIVGQKAKSN